MKFVFLDFLVEHANSHQKQQSNLSGQERHEQDPRGPQQRRLLHRAIFTLCYARSMIMSHVRSIGHVARFRRLAQASFSIAAS